MNQIVFHAGNSPNHNRDEQSFDPLNETHAHSNHPSGVNTVFGDAHAEFIPNTIDMGIWRALSTASGREPHGLAGSY